MLALLAVVAPKHWIATSHELLKLGDFPTEPIAGYLARSISIWYAAYGLLLWFVSYDVDKFAQLITCLAWMMIIQGLFVIGIDTAEGMPGWWTAVEGPCSSGLGVGILVLQRWANKPLT